MAWLRRLVDRFWTWAEFLLPGDQPERQNGGVDYDGPADWVNELRSQRGQVIIPEGVLPTPDPEPAAESVAGQEDPLLQLTPEALDAEERERQQLSSPWAAPQPQRAGEPDPFEDL